MFVLNIDRILADSEVCHAVKFTLSEIRRIGYITPGQWLQSLSTHDITFYLDLVTKAQIAEAACLNGQDVAVEDDRSAFNLLILAEALAMAESESSDGIAQAVDNVNFLMTLITMESLRRKGLIEIFYDKITFSPQHADVPISCITEKGAELGRNL